MNIHCAILAYALDISPVVDAIMPAGGVTLHLYTHSARPVAVQSCHRALAQYPDAVRLYDFRTNRGNERSCNEFFQMALADSADAIIALNDDITINRADFDRLAQGCVDHPEAGLIFCDGFNAHAGVNESLAWVAFGINRIAFEKVGFLDETFWPTYFSDTDYSMRCHKFSVPTHNIGDTSIVHQGSTTFALVPELRATYPINEAYYSKKHGGVPGQETFQYPFNDPSKSWFIGAKQHAQS